MYQNQIFSIMRMRMSALVADILTHGFQKERQELLLSVICKRLLVFSTSVCLSKGK